MGSRWGPPDGWDELPDCATDCFRDGLSETGCEEGDERCLCEGDNWAIVGKSLDDCKDCSGSDLWRLGASYQVICDSVERESASPTPYTESSTATYATAHGGTPSSAAGAQSTTLTFIPIASHTPSQSDLDSTSLQSRNQIPKSAIIGMSVGFVVAALLIAGLSIFWLRERKRRKSLEWSTESKRGSRLSLGSKRASKRSTKGESSTQVTETGIWRPSGATSTPSP